MGANVLHAHHIIAHAAVLCAEHGVDEARLAAHAACGAVCELRLKAEGIFKLVVLVNDLRLNDVDLAAAVRQINETFIAELELTLQCAVVLVGDQVRLSERGVRLHAELRGGHHRAEETLRRGLRELPVRAERGERDAGKAFRRNDARQRLCDLALHLLDVVLHGQRLAALHGLRGLRVLDKPLFHDALSSLIENLLNVVCL